MTARRVLALTALACGTICAQASAEDADLAAARAAWRQAGLTQYEYGYEKYCECHPESPPETIVTVRDDAVVSVRHRPPNVDFEVPAEQRNFEFYWTVDALFDLLESAQSRGVEVRADYDSTLGYPTRIYIDYDADFIGDELVLHLTRVVALDRE